MKVLILANELKYVCGVSSHLSDLITGLSSNKIELLIICGGGDRVKELIDLGINIKSNSLFLHQKRSKIKFVLAVIYLYWICRIKKIQVIHSHHYYVSNMASIVSRYLRVATIQTNHGLIQATPQLPLFCANEIIVVNEHIYDFVLREKIVSQPHLHLIRNGVRFSAMKSQKDNDKIKIIAASRLVHGKGIDLFVKAIQIIQKNIKRSVEFIIAGDGEEESYLKKMSYETGTEITFLGAVKNMSELFSQTHIFVNPTRSTEGFPLSLVEAGFYSNLIITSDFNGLKSVFVDKQDGLVFEMNNFVDLSRKLLNAIENYEDQKIYIDNFNLKVNNLFSQSEMINKITSLYHSVKQTK